MPTIHYSSDEVGAPTLNNAPGSLIAVLDACLVTGIRPITGVSISVSSGVATLTYASHGYLANTKIEVAGAATAAINGVKLLTTSANNTATFAAPGVPDGAISGTISVKRPPLGWTKAFAGTNKAIYQRTAAQAKPQLIRVDDTGATPTVARVLMVESASGVDAYGAASPTSAQLAGGQFWAKGQDDTSAKPWVLVGDGLSFYLLTDNDGARFSIYGGLAPQGFGDLVCNRSGDPYGSFLMGAINSNGGSNAMRYGVLDGISVERSLVVARRASGVGGSVCLGVLACCYNGAPGTQGPVYPSPVDNGMDLQVPVRVREENSGFGHPVRGVLPGLALPMANIGTSLHMTRLSPVSGLDRAVLVVGAVWGSTGIGLSPGALAFDVDGPWQ